MGAHPDSISGRITARIRAKGKGVVFTPPDFLDLGSRAAVDQTLSRLVRSGLIRKVGRGIYDRPRDHQSLGRLSPSVDSVAKAVAQRAGAMLLPSGAQAANLLGLTEQVPMKVLYLTDSATRRIRVGKATVILKRTPPRMLRTKSPTSALVIQAMRWIGRNNVDDNIVARLRHNLAPRDRKALIRDAPQAPGWIADLFHRLAEDIPIKISRYDAEAIRREKGRDRQAIQRATPSQREAMQASHSLVGDRDKDLSFDLSKATTGFY